MSNGSELFTDKVITGDIYETRLNATINPPNALSDPFKSKVEGSILSENKGTKLELTVKFGIVNILAILIWYLPMLFVFQYEKNQDLKSVLAIFGMCLLFSLFSLFLLKLKVNWDKRRLEEWLISKLK